MLRGELDRVHRALRVHKHRALDPSRRTRRSRGTRAIQLRAIKVGRGYLLPYFDGTVEGGCSEDRAKLGMRPRDF